MGRRGHDRQGGDPIVTSSRGLTYPDVAQVHMTEAELAERLQLSPATLTTWRSRGRGPRYMKPGGAVRYRLEDVLTWEEANLHG